MTGESKSLTLDDKEKLYLECLDAFYNEGGKQMLPDDEYEKLKLDLDFDGSRVAVFSKVARARLHPKVACRVAACSDPSARSCNVHY